MGQITQKIFDIFISLMAIVRTKLIFFGKTIGPGVRIYGKVFCTGKGRLVIGPRVYFHKGPQGSEINTQEKGQITIGEGTCINHGCIINSSESISIGRRCRLGYGVIILDSDLHRMEPSLRHVRPPPRPVQMDDDVWIGARAIILAGVHIGRGSIIGAGSVVRGNIPPMSLAAGVPAKVIRSIKE